MRPDVRRVLERHVLGWRVQNVLRIRVIQVRRLLQGQQEIRAVAICPTVHRQHNMQAQMGILNTHPSVIIQIQQIVQQPVLH